MEPPEIRVTTFKQRFEVRRADLAGPAPDPELLRQVATEMNARIDAEIVGLFGGWAPVIDTPTPRPLKRVKVEVIE